MCCVLCCGRSLLGNVQTSDRYADIEQPSGPLAGCLCQPFTTSPTLMQHHDVFQRSFCGQTASPPGKKLLQHKEKSATQTLFGKTSWCSTKVGRCEWMTKTSCKSMLLRTLVTTSALFHRLAAGNFLTCCAMADFSLCSAAFFPKEFAVWPQQTLLNNVTMTVSQVQFWQWTWSVEMAAR